MTEPTGNRVVDEFLAELDARIDGERGTPPDSAARLAAIRPTLRAMAVAMPEAVEARIGDLLAQFGWVRLDDGTWHPPVDP